MPADWGSLPPPCRPCALYARHCQLLDALEYSATACPHQTKHKRDREDSNGQRTVVSSVKKLKRYCPRGHLLSRAQAKQTKALVGEPCQLGPRVRQRSSLSPSPSQSSMAWPTAEPTKAISLLSPVQELFPCRCHGTSSYFQDPWPSFTVLGQVARRACPDLTLIKRHLRTGRALGPRG